MMQRLPATLAAIGSRGGLRRVLLAYAVSGLVEFSTWVAIILYAYAQGGPRLVGLVTVAQVLPAAIVSPLLAGVGDRMTRGTALVLVYALMTSATALTLVALVVGAPVPVVVAGAALCTIAHASARPIHFAVLPQLSRTPEQLVSGNALSSISDGFAMFLGPAVAGVAAALVGPWLVFAVGTVLAVLAAALCLALGLAPPAVVAGAEPSALREAMEGVAALWRDLPALALLLIVTTGFVVIGAMDVLAVTFSERVLGQGDAGAGAILSGIGIGALVGGAVAGVVAMRRSLAPVVLLGGVLMGSAVAAISLLSAIGPTVVALTVSGLGGAILMVGGRTLLQRTSDERLLARIFGVQESASLIGVALGAAVAPILIERTSPAGAFVPFGLGTVGVAAIGFLLVRRLDARAVLRPAEVALLRRVPFLSVLPQYELERLAQHATWMDVEAGADVVRQGEPGDLFYVVASGEFAVIVDGLPRPDTLGPGQGFGEVALMHAVARTAGVVARTPGRLLAVGSADFLAAVTGSPDGHKIALEVSGGHLGADSGER